MERVIATHHHEGHQLDVIALLDALDEEHKAPPPTARCPVRAATRVPVFEPW